MSRRPLVHSVVYLGVATVLSAGWVICMPQAQSLAYAPLLLVLFMIPVAVTAFSSGPRPAFVVGGVGFSIAAVVFCAPAFLHVGNHDVSGPRASRSLRVVLEADADVSPESALGSYLERGGTLAELLDRGAPKSLLEEMWPDPWAFRTAYRAYLTRPLFETGLFWQILIFLMSGPFLGVVAEGGRHQRERLEAAHARIRSLEAAMSKERSVRSTGHRESEDEINYLQSMLITLSDMAREISSAMQEDTIFKQILKKTMDLLRTRHAALFRPDAKGRHLVLVAASGYDVQKLSELRIPISEEGGVVGWSAKHRLFLSMDEALADYHKMDLTKANRLETLYSQPVVRSGELLLVICVGPTERRLAHKQVSRLMSTLANFSAIAMDNARLLERTRQQAIRDGLTGLYNHRHFQEEFDRILADAQVKGHSVACLLMDIDHFKRLNDTHGHLAGDEVLRRVAAVLRERVPSEDLEARYGGEEFVAVLSGKSLHESRQIADTLREAVEEARIRVGAETLEATISVGGVWWTPAGGRYVKKDEMIRLADEALYRAKKAGRNRVVFQDKIEDNRSFAQGA